MAGAVSGVTLSARNPSGINKIRLRGWLFWAKAGAAKLADDKARKPKQKNEMERRMGDSLSEDLPLRAAMPGGSLV